MELEYAAVVALPENAMVDVAEVGAHVYGVVVAVKEAVVDGGMGLSDSGDAIGIVRPRSYHLDVVDRHGDAGGSDKELARASDRDALDREVVAAGARMVGEGVPARFVLLGEHVDRVVAETLNNALVVSKFSFQVENLLSAYLADRQESLPSSERCSRGSWNGAWDLC